ncbi:MAG: hypothetical protein JXA18_15695 [Chitinispirillaceae bacterium]|nr:hypothetical protein [Chitinispirillaceae bacterium]
MKMLRRFIETPSKGVEEHAEESVPSRTGDAAGSKQGIRGNKSAEIWVSEKE